MTIGNKYERAKERNPNTITEKKRNGNKNLLLSYMAVIKYEMKKLCFISVLRIEFIE